MGSIYKRGKTYWVQWFVNGKVFHESAKTSKAKEAKDFLRQKENAGLPTPQITLSELLNMIEQDYKINQYRSIHVLKICIRHLLDILKDGKVSSISSEKINEYVIDRREDGVTDDSILRELSVLRRSFNLAKKLGKLTIIPYFPTLKAAEPRKGYFTEEEYRKLIRELPYYLRPLVALGYFSGMRKGELLNLLWSDVDLMEGKVTIRAEISKNKSSRYFYLNENLLGWLRLMKANSKSEYVFTHNNKRITRFIDAWNSACERAGIGKKLPHDLRRSAVRNMDRQGIPHSVIMSITGHKDHRVFLRYDITGDQGLRKVANLQNSYNSATFSEIMEPNQSISKEEN